MDFDSVITLGGQSLVEALWRLVGPALAPLASPLPMAVPGMTAVTLRVRKLTPGKLSASGFGLDLEVEVRGSALLAAVVGAGTLAVSDAKLGIPARQGTITLPALGQAGTIDLPAVDQAITFPETIDIPVPAVVPLPLDLTGGGIRVHVELALEVDPVIDAASAFGLGIRLRPSTPTVSGLPSSEALATTLEAGRKLLSTILLGSESALPAPALPFEKMAQTLIESVSAEIVSALTQALSSLVGRTGRLLHSSSRTEHGCIVKLLPTFARARLLVDNDDGLVLQIGFARRRATEFPDVRTFRQAEAIINVKSTYLRDVLCCLIRDIPGVAIGAGEHRDTGDERSDELCCTWGNVTLDVWPVMLSGSLSLCINRRVVPRRLELRGTFQQRNDLLSIDVSFTLALAFDVNGLAALTSLRFLAQPEITVSVQPSLLLGATIVGAAAGAILVPGVSILAVAVPALLVRFLEQQLRDVCKTLLETANLPASASLVPTGVLEAFGPLVPATLAFADDLVISGALGTPTSDWPLDALALSRRLPPGAFGPGLGPLTGVDG